MIREIQPTVEGLLRRILTPTCTTNTSGWKDGAIEKAIEIAKQRGIAYETGVKMYGTEKAPVLRLYKKGGLGDFWAKLKEEVPEYWKGN